MKYRHELKYRINNMDVVMIGKRFNSVIARDRYCTDNEGYIVKSLYFDNYMDKALAEKINGLNRREKFRIRCYNNDMSLIKLEKKSKINGISCKTSCLLSEKLCRNIIDGNYSDLLLPGNDLAKEFYCKVKYQVLRPRNIVEYNREAFVYVPGNVRVTLDTKIRGSNNVKAFMSEDDRFLPLLGFSILEIKWDEYLPQIIRDLAQTNTRMVSSFSKYAATRVLQ